MPRFHELYDQQAQLTPRSPAFCCLQKSICTERSYGELQVRSYEVVAGINRTISSLSTNSSVDPPLVGVHLPRIHEDFLPLLVALSRCNLAFVLLSTDLRDKDLERARNVLISKELKPSLIVSSIAAGENIEATLKSAHTDSGCLRVIEVETLTGDWANSGCTSCGNTSPLCFLFTGGTTRGRCVTVTHEMVSHERDRYKEVLPLSPPVRVLANTSVYWGASALGQVSIALAYGGCAVFSEASEADDIRAAVGAGSTDVLGLVPDQLRALADNPAADLPSLRAIFTWGERLPPAVAERWRSHSSVQLRELLISTEYWLSLYASPLEDAGRLLRVVRGVQMLVVNADGHPVGEGEIGELLLAGPMVTSGYVALSNSSNDPVPFRSLNGVTYFCTRDLVRILRGNLLEFCGRADMTTKEKGKWVDLLAIQEVLQSSDGIADAAVLPNPGRTGEPHAFLALHRDSDTSTVIRAARLALPHSAQVHVLDHFPRHPVTRKVDVKNLQAIIRRAEPGTWPLTVDAAIPPHIATRARAKVRSHVCWTCGALAAAAMWDVQGLTRLLFGAARRSPAQRCAAPVTIAGLALLPFMHLATLHVIDQWELFRRILNEFPLSMWGAMFAALAARGVAPPGSIVRVLLSSTVLAWAGTGAAVAVSRERLLSWPVVFWWGIGHRLDYDCSRWLYKRMWSDYFHWQTSRLLYCLWLPMFLPGSLMSRFGVPKSLQVASAVVDAKAPAGQISEAADASTTEEVRAKETAACSQTESTTSPGESAETASAKTVPELPACDWCQREVQMEWPPAADLADIGSGSPAGGAYDKDGKAVCWQCWPRVSAFGMDEAVELTGRLFGDACDPEPRSAALTGDVTEPELESRSDLEPEDTENQSAHRTAEETDENPCNPCPQVDNVDVLDSNASTVDEASGATLDESVSPGEAEVSCNSAASMKKPDSSKWSADQAEKWEKWKESYEMWWWYNKTQKDIDVQPWSLELYFGRQSADASAAAPSEPSDPRLRRVCRCVERIDDAAVGPSAPLHGLDSLRVSLLTTRLRAEFGIPRLSIAAVRRAANPTELLQLIDTVEQATPAESQGAAREIPDCGKYAIYFSPGQYVPMGAWVVRTSAEVDSGRMEEATRKLVERHASLRSKAEDDMRIMSFFLDAGITFTLAARILAEGSWPARLLRACASWGLRRAWPRMIVAPRKEVYADHPAQTPFEVVKAGGQPAVELVLRKRRSVLHYANAPLDVALVRLEAELVGLWVYGYKGGEGDFAILPDPRNKVAGQLLFADRCRGEVGVLVGPGDPRWVPPPYGFPALLCARLAPGTGVVWLRLTKPREVVLLWKANAGVRTRWCRFLAFQMPGAPGPTSVFSFLCVSAMHHIADGMSYEAIVGDLLAFYASLAPVSNEDHSPPPPPPPPLLTNGFAELERRLISTLETRDYDACTQQISMRGNLWRFKSRGYGHLVNLQRGAIRALGHVSRAYGAPLDALMLALSAAAIARASNSDVVPLTLYVPVRDGPGEAGLVGLFADWRNIAVQTDRETATVIGVVLDVAYTLRTRRWAVFNAIMKPEATMVNFQPLDVVPPESRAGFKQVGEELWRIGECLKNQDGRSGEMSWVPQPMSLTIEQQDRETWYIIVTCAYDSHPPCWMRRFLKAFEDAFWALLGNPTQRVHTKYSDDFY